MLITVGAYLLAILWWRMWMYEGFFGPITLLEPFVTTDGEGVYNRVELEMFLNIYIPILFAFIYFLRKKAKPE